MRKFIIFDTFNTPFHNNRIFDPEVARHYPGALAAVRFYELATRAGYTVLTCDLFESKGISPKEAILITEQWSPYTARLILRGALPGIVISHETLFSWSFYSNLRKISSLYQHVFVFEGARKWVDESRARFYKLYYPQAMRGVVDIGIPWGNKRFMVLISSNNPPPAGFRYRLACLREPALRNDLHAERLRATAHFSHNPGFHLYGRNWATQQPWLSNDLKEAVARCYQGECEDKVATLAQYRFAICFENLRFSGYVTEKIFDCFFAGCIPVYYGAPDIERYVPKETFVDLRQFNTYEELAAFLAVMTPEQASRYLKAASAFLDSPAFEPFYQESFAQKLVDAVNSCATTPATARPNLSLSTQLWLMADIGVTTGKRRLRPLVRFLRGQRDHP